MPSAEINSAVVTRQVEKPHHYTYLKSFRTEQCKDFLNHRCNQHRPFTCFFWHFPNQKRRRPVFNAKDGTFNYSPDVYCTSYDESTGICPQGDSCTYLHRNIGDTEKRYHLRYYKTERCIIDTENKGSCTKNGPHCAFAHGPDDLRAPVFDITERNVVNAKPADQSIEAEVNGEKEKEKIANIDPVWFDENYIKLFYKTEPCTRTSRHVTLSCPFYHNPKDRRRRHDIHKYRAVVCPEVKHKEEWTDPAECGLGDKCPYIHTRTEQQYHPDIYKTDKCHEEAANGRCSKGIFCAFAHDNPTMPQVSPVRSVSCHGENSSSNASQGKIAPGTELQSRVGRIKMPSNGNAVGQIITNGMTLQPGTGSGTNSDTDSNWLGFSSIKLDPRTNDGDIQSRLKQIQPMASEIGAFYDPAKPDYPMSMYTTTKPQASGSAMPLSNYNSGATSIESSFKAASLMPADNDTHLMDRLDSLDEDDDSNHALLGMPNSGLVGGARILPSEVPQMSIFNTAPTGTMPPPRFSPFATVGMGNSTAGLSLSSNVGFNYSLPGFPSANGGYVTGQTSRLAMYGLSLQPTEVERLKSEVDDARQIIQRLTEEKLQATQERDLLIQHHHHHQTNAMSDSALSNGTYLRRLIPSANLEALSVPYLQDIQVQLQLDLRRVQMAMSRQAGGKCLACLERMATTLLPCKHKSLCEPCLIIAKNCPLCGASIPDQQAF